MRNGNISISGAQCTGKTTLLNQISEDPELDSQFKLVKEVVRTIKKRWESQGKSFFFNRNGDFKSQMAVFEEHHRNVLFNKTPIITDRSALDAFVYATYNYQAGNFTFEEYKKFKTVFIETIPNYQIFIYLPVGLIDIEDDGVRDIDAVFQKEIDRLYRKICKNYFITLYELPIDGRLKKLKSVIKSREI